MVRDVATAKYAREQLNANVIGMGGRITGIGLMENIIDVFLETEYKETEKNKKWIEKIDGLIEEDSSIGDEHFFDEFLLIILQ